MDDKQSSKLEEDRRTVEAVKYFQDVVQHAVDKLNAGGPESFRGNDWWQLSDAEQEVFGLELSQMGLLVTVYDAYEGVVGISHNDFYAHKELCAGVRAALPWLTTDTGSENEFRKFADLFAIAQDKAHCIYHKISLWQYRQGLVSFQVPK